MIHNTEHSDGPNGRLLVAELFGIRVAETILASAHVWAHQQAGHMDASNLIKTLPNILQVGARPHMGPRGVVDGEHPAFVWCPKYPRSVLTHPIDAQLKALFAEIAAEHGMRLHAVEVIPDHVHLFVDVMLQRKHRSGVLCVSIPHSEAYTSTHCFNCRVSRWPAIRFSAVA